MKTMMAACVAAGVLLAAPALAQSGADVLKSKGCLNCHAMDKKKVGPAYKDVAAKYHGKANAEAQLVEKLKTGKGHMKVKATDDELHAAIKQVLSTK
jgi:cytochrome c